MADQPTPSFVPSPIPPLALRQAPAAEALGISLRLLQVLTKAGEVPHLRLGKAVLYPVRDLEQWLSERAAAEGRS